MYNKKSLVYSTSLMFLWLIYVLNRALDGFPLISDEVFYFYQNIDFESKRIIFLNLVQFFDDTELSKDIVISINIFTLLISYYFLSKINFHNYSATFFQLIYFSAIASYIFRDTLVLFIFVLFTYILIKNKFISNLFYAKKLFSINILLLLFLLFLMMDFRPHYTAFFIFSWMGAVIAVRRSNYSIFFLLILSTLSLYVYAKLIMSSFFIYGITGMDYLATRTERHDVELTVINYFIGLVKHFFAPIPTSLLSRMLDSESWNIYGCLDDLYRLVYKSFIYFVFLYIIINIRFVKQVFSRWKGEMYFLLIFSLSNAILYTFFAFGGGHERIKIFSTFFVVFLYSAIKNLKSNKTEDIGKNK